VIDEPQVALRSFNGEVSYTDGQYLGHFNAALDGPAGAFSLTSPFSGSLKQIACRN
jgi:translocation and assembly module TamB